MSSQVFPSLIGLGFDVMRQPYWEGSARIASLSGKETAIAYQASPKWEWELTYDLLRSTASKLEFQTLAGFFNQMRGVWDDFLYTDADDYTTTDSAIGSGDGVEVDFQLVRTMGDFAEPILAPNVVTNVKVDGVTVDPSDYTVLTWGDNDPGVIRFDTAPANGLAVTATFTYYWPVRFLDNTMTFKKFMNQMWNGKSVKFRSVK